MLLQVAFIFTVVSGADAFARHGICQVTRSNSASVQLGATEWTDSLTSQNPKSNICIVGGGFGGLYTALKVSSLIRDNEDIAITLIDPKDKFVFSPLLYELAVGTASVSEVSPKYSSLLKGSKVEFIQAAVDKIDLGRDEIILNAAGANERIKFQQLVLAVGAQPRLDLIPGAKDYSLPFYRVEDAYKLQSYLRALVASDRHIIRVVVLGGGYSGVEVATSVAQFLEKTRTVITLVDRNSKIMHTSPAHNREVAEKALANYGVSVNSETTVKRVTPTGVTVVDNEGLQYDIEADLVICTSGMEQTEVIMGTKLTKDSSGRILTSRTLQSKDRNNVFALGDCASIEGYPLPSTAQVAMQQASIVSKNLVNRARQFNQPSQARNPSKPDELEKFKFVPLGEMLSLGTLDAAISGLGGLVELEGPLAALGRRITYSVRMPTVKQQISALVSAGVTNAGNVAVSLMEKVNGKK
jgi:NADH dehydrogenase